MRRFGLFVGLTTAGAFGAIVGALIGATWGDLGFIAGGFVVGLLIVLAAVSVAARLGCIALSRRKHVRQGAVVGFLAFATLTLATMIGPLLCVVLTGVGAVVADIDAENRERRLPSPAV
jgi:hypothetical protein